mmetsp:Transcript_5248/g.10731  ORF Transcript_5248/g.10731 Transcript_5248/m.10731 type:complete len:101 (-) Transcript_5248:2597-2899(-)
MTRLVEGLVEDGNWQRFESSTQSPVLPEGHDFGHMTDELDRLEGSPACTIVMVIGGASWAEIATLRKALDSTPPFSGRVLITVTSVIDGDAFISNIIHRS